MSTEKSHGLAAALSKFQGEMPSVGKTKTAQIKSDKGSYSYKYADLGDVVDAAYPIMSRHGLAFSAKPTLNDSGHFVLAYKLMHESGEDEHGEYPLPANGSPQQMGSAITYARRYTLTSVLGIVSEEDDDGRGAPQEREPSSRAPRQRPANARPDADAQRRKYHVLRERLGWDEDAGHDYINDLSKGRATRWSELNATQRSAVLDGMQDVLDGLGPNFPVNTETGEVPIEDDQGR